MKHGSASESKKQFHGLFLERLHSKSMNIGQQNMLDSSSKVPSHRFKEEIKPGTESAQYL